MATFEIVGVDPGEHTGLAYLRVEDDRRSFRSEQCFRHRAVRKLEHHARNINYRGERLRVVCERFDIGRETLRAPVDSNIAIRTIGAAEYVSATWGAEFELYGRADAKTLAGEELLRALGFWNPGRGHANDAARQVVMDLSRRFPHVLEEMVQKSGYLK